MSGHFPRLGSLDTVGTVPTVLTSRYRTLRVFCPELGLAGGIKCRWYLQNGEEYGLFTRVAASNHTQ